MEQAFGFYEKAKKAIEGQTEPGSDGAIFDSNDRAVELAPYTSMLRAAGSSIAHAGNILQFSLLSTLY